MGKWKEYNQQAPGIIADKIKGKIADAKQDPRVAGVVVLEMVLTLILAIGIIVYLDPDVNLVPFPQNAIGFLTILIITVFLYRYSKAFRLERKRK